MSHQGVSNLKRGTAGNRSSTLIFFNQELSPGTLDCTPPVIQSLSCRYACVLVCCKRMTGPGCVPYRSQGQQNSCTRKNARNFNGQLSGKQPGYGSSWKCVYVRGGLCSPLISSLCRYRTLELDGTVTPCCSRCRYTGEHLSSGKSPWDPKVKRREGKKSELWKGAKNCNKVIGAKRVPRHGIWTNSMEFNSALFFFLAVGFELGNSRTNTCEFICVFSGMRSRMIESTLHRDAFFLFVFI